MNKHTPGPWKVVDASVARSVDVFEIAEVAYLRVIPDRAGDTYAGHGDAESDASLIAAAPELLEALRDLLSGWMYIREIHGDLYGVGWDRSQEKARAAIAKAEGLK